ncbi:hypothetical protein FQZ97_1205630 [compost metagenome]
MEYGHIAEICDIPQLAFNRIYRCIFRLVAGNTGLFRPYCIPDLLARIKLLTGFGVNMEAEFFSGDFRLAIRSFYHLTFNDVHIADEVGHKL